MLENSGNLEAEGNYTRDKEISDEEYHELAERMKERANFINVLAEEVRKTGDRHKEILWFVEWAKFQLRSILGIDDLTDIEAVHLRKIVERIFDQYKIDLELVDQGKLSGITPFQLDFEAMALWLKDLYGIDIYTDVPRINVVIDETTKESFHFQRSNIAGAKNKMKQLETDGHKVWIDNMIIPKDFKEYIRRLREKAHNL